ncbi:hypothetical protein TWF970_009990 [Orbilia oligospora]|uniref:Uncharacterized protein n=1 Tax=Orbilia oligospora TaxID=2813651 RepID=A0A7C8V0X7_ORBOL|nr:hypothetical protein TWF970_009990 [Orbilia oligospora]
MEVAGGVEPTEKQVNPGKNLLKEEGKENNRADGCSACMALEDRLPGSMHSGGGRAVKNDFGLVPANGVSRLWRHKGHCMARTVAVGLCPKAQFLNTNLKAPH